MSTLRSLDGVPNGLTSTRRQFLKRAVIMTAAVPISLSLLAACGGDDAAEDDDDEDEVAATEPEAAMAEPPATAATGEGATATEAEQELQPAATEASGAPSVAPPASMCPSAEYSTVGALSIANGAVEWFVCSPNEAYRTVIGASDHVVLIEESGPIEASGSASRSTIAYDAADGSERWRRSTADNFTPAGPFDGQGIVVLADQDARALVGVDVVTGEEQWRVESSEAPLANSPTVAVVWNVAGPGSSVGFRGIDRLTGDELWVSETMLSDQSGNFVARSPAAVLGEVLAVPTGSTVTTIDMRTGAILWQAPQIDDPAAAGGIIIGTRGATVTAIDAASGQELWTAPGRPSYGDLLAVGDGVIAVFGPGTSGLVAYELSSGDERWRATLTAHVEPQLISGTSLIMLWNGDLAVLSTTDGATIWSATEPFGSALMNSVGSNGDVLFVAINSLPWRD